MSNKEYLKNTFERIFHLEYTGIEECKVIISILEKNGIDTGQLKEDLIIKF